MRQSGLLIKEKPEDWILGSTSPLLEGDVVNEAGDWRLWAPTGEKQSNLKIDTMSCTTFSALSDLETLLTFFKDRLNLFSKEQLEWLNLNKYIEKGKFNFSDKFTAVMSGTMPQGNYFQNVWDSIRKDGVIPEKDLSMGNPKTWNEYHDKTKITDEMKNKGREFLEKIIEKGEDGKYKINYEFVPMDTLETNLVEALKRSPIQVAVTKEQPIHAILLLKSDYEFETYKPFLRERKRSISYALKISVKIKNITPPPVYTYFNLKSDPKMAGLKHELMVKLDALRHDLKLPIIITSGLRTKEENDALKKSASNSGHLRGYEVDILCTDGKMRDRVIELSYKYGFTRRGIGEDFVHLGIDPSLPQNVMWHYYEK